LPGCLGEASATRSLALGSRRTIPLAEPYRIMKLRLATALLTILVPAALATQEKPLLIPQLTGPIELDGMSDEPAWEAVEPIHLIAHAPTYGGEPTEPTEVRVAHDGEHLYVAARLYDSEPHRAEGLSLRRNYAGGDNWMVVVLDTFDDRETAVAFATTPAGVRTDLEISNDAEGDGGLNFDWNSYWDVEVVRSREGWYAEFRIPFSSLRFQERDGQVRMGISFWRMVARTEELSTYPARPPQWGFNSVFKPSQTRPAELEGVRGTRPLYVVPYALAGGGQSFVLNEDGSAYARVDTPVREVGLDLKYGVSDNLTLDLAFNPDFAQVEADQQEINLTRFSLFFPEKRLFFQERSSAFAFSLGGVDRLFHSRRIGLVQGEPARIWGGGRLVGRIGEWDVAGLNMQTGASEVFPSENFGVVRLRRRVLNENSYAGGILTSRVGPEGAYNVAYGLDANLRLFGQDYLTLNWAQTFDADDGAPEVLDRGFARARWERRGMEGFGYAIDLSRAGAAFDPAVGFMLRHDYTRLGERVYYGWRPADGSRVFRHTVALNGTVYRRNADGSTETAELGPEWALQTRTGHALTLAARTVFEDLRHGFLLGPDVDVPAGSYRFHGAELGYGMPSGQALRTTARASVGSFFDGSRASFGLFPSWRMSRHLELTGGYAFDRVVFPDRDQRLTAHVARARAEVMASARLSAAVFAQYNSAADAVITNVRLRYNPREGQDLYVVYNHGLHTSRHRMEPFLPATDSRTLLVKYSHAVDMGF
jgi:hypothetical protein